MTGDAIEAVRKHLRDGGIPLEYAAARTLTAAGFQALQRRAYTDPNEGRRREIDVIGDVASRDVDGPNLKIRVSLVFECKHTTVPWIVLTESAHVLPSDVLGGMIATERAATILVTSAKRAGVTAPAFFRVAPLHGFGIAIAGRDDREGHEALQQVTSACFGIASSGQFSWIVTWPALVIDGPLFLASYDADGQDHVEAVQEARLIWHGGSSIRAVPVDVVRIDHLPDYAERALRGLRDVRERLEFEWAKLVRESS